MARFSLFFPRLNPLALVPLGLGPENLAKHNFKSTLSQLAQKFPWNLGSAPNMQRYANHRSKQTRNNIVGWGISYMLEISV
jgi:ribosomal protein S17E